MIPAKVLPISDEPDWRQHALPIMASLVVFSIFSIWGAITSEGFLEADAITHYLYARFAISEPHYLVNVWGRPLCTGLYALPAYFFGRIGVRIVSLILALGVSWTAYAIAKGQKHRWPALAMMFTLAQPLLFLHSFSELTELPFALILGLAFLAYQRKQFFWMALLVAISPLGRPEGFGFIGLAAVALVLHRQWAIIPFLFVGLLGWTYAGWQVFGSPRYDSSMPLPFHGLLWLKHEWPYAGDSLYERGNIFKYLALLPAVVSPFLFPAMVVGLFSPSPLAGEGRGEGAAPCDNSGTNADRCPTPHPNPLPQGERGSRILIAVIPFLILTGHSILHALGKMASSGELRYLLIVAPFWALLAARGWEWLSTRLDLQSPIRIAAILCVLPCLIQVKVEFKGYTFGYQTLPLKLNDDMLAAKRFAEWYKAWPEREKYPRLMASHPGTYLFLNKSPTDPSESVAWFETNFRTPPNGVVLAWDDVYGLYNADARRSVRRAELDAVGWVGMLQPWIWDNRISPGRNPYIFVSPYDINGDATPFVLGKFDSSATFSASRTYVSRSPPPR
jgi:hypothetical protein